MLRWPAFLDTARNSQFFSDVRGAERDPATPAPRSTLREIGVPVVGGMAESRARSLFDELRLPPPRESTIDGWSLLERCSGGGPSRSAEVGDGEYEAPNRCRQSVRMPDIEFPRPTTYYC